MKPDSGPPVRKVVNSWGWTKFSNIIVFHKDTTDSDVVVRVTEEEAEYFQVGQAYSFFATQP